MRPFVPGVLLRLGRIVLVGLVSGWAFTARTQAVLSEFLADNATGLRDEDGDTSDWIEISNPTGDPAPLAAADVLVCESTYGDRLHERGEDMRRGLDEALTFAHSLPFDVGQTFGGHSSCVELEAAPPSGPNHDYVLCDMGSGLRPFGGSVLARHGARAANTFHIFISHAPEHAKRGCLLAQTKLGGQPRDLAKFFRKIIFNPRRP
mgnify:CR=1 FL=1